MLRVSVITVVKNDLDNFKKTVASIMSQTFLPVEFVIKDGGSDVNSQCYYEVVKREINNTIVISEPDEGIFDAMNSAIDFCTGDLVIFLNAGDVFASPEALESCVANIREPHGLNIFSWIQGEEVYRPNLKLNGLIGGCPCHQAIIYGRNILASMKFDSELRFCADYAHLLCVIARKQRIDTHGTILVVYDQSGVSSQRKNRKRIWEERAASIRRSKLPLRTRFPMFIYNFIRYHATK
jgi:glycosyltransferase involved in cell wall biosynthesis